MTDREINFRLPLEDWPRAVFQTDYRFRGGVLVVQGQKLLAFADREALTRGGTSTFRGRAISIKLAGQPESPELDLVLEGTPAVREDRIRLKPSRSAWVHATIALLGSGFGFAASYLYLIRAQNLADAWALKMAMHTAGWHLLLTLTMFPASVFGQRTGIRIVQATSLVFFFIHLGMALANGPTSAALDGPGIAAFNALSGLFFLMSVIYGQRAHRDMSPASLFSRP